MNFKKFGLTALALSTLMAGSALAQRRVCGTDELEAQNMQNPAYQRNFEAHEAEYVKFVESGRTQRSTSAVRKIPVVVHFIQSSDVELVSDAMIYSQIDVLNEDFRKMAGTAGDGSGVDTEYEFCLASIDPFGCPTTGINRVVAPQWAYHDQADAFSMKGLIQWDPYKYLNVWVPRTIETSSGLGQVIGYATLPWNITLAPNLDGIVIHSGFIGRTSNPTYGGRTTTHEVGHWLGLLHTFQNACQGSTAATCASQGDRVCDTPQAADANFGCPSVNSCVDSPVDDPDLIENYMDYSDGTCQDMFTAGQKTRMDFYTNSVRSILWSPSNLAATGCDGTVSAGCAPAIDFEANKIIVCVGDSVNFTDLTRNTPTGWNWTFAGGSPGTSTLQNPTVQYNTAGSYNVVLNATNSLGQNTATRAGYIEVVEPSPNPLVQGFEGILSLPQLWTIEDNGGLRTWQLATNARSEGQNSMKVNNFEARNAGERVRLISNPFSMQNMLTAELSFDYSYKKFSGLTQEGMRVFISTDCGSSWTMIWEKMGAYLATVAGNATATEWVPTLATHWLADTVNLDSFAGAPNVKLAFEVETGGGQAVYIDRINIGGTFVGIKDQVALNWDFVLAPNPFNQSFELRYDLQQASSLEFTLTDLSGRTLRTVATGTKAAGRHVLQFSDEELSQLPAGVYFLKGESSKGSITRKLVKLN